MHNPIFHCLEKQYLVVVGKIGEAHLRKNLIRRVRVQQFCKGLVHEGNRRSKSLFKYDRNLFNPGPFFQNELTNPLALGPGRDGLFFVRLEKVSNQDADHFSLC